MKFRKTAETLEDGARTLERDYYVNPKILKKEYEKIFLKNWICAGRVSELSNKGKYKVINLGTESAIILRDSSNALKAFTNVCRHRGTRICNELKGEFSKSIQCSYHGWTYDLSGNLVGAPHMDSVEGFIKSDYPLYSIAIAEWGGFIFINFENKPESFKKEFSPILSKFTNWNISDLVPIETKTYQSQKSEKLVFPCFLRNMFIQ